MPWLSACSQHQLSFFSLSAFSLFYIYLYSSEQSLTQKNVRSYFLFVTPCTSITKSKNYFYFSDCVHNFHFLVFFRVRQIAFYLSEKSFFLFYSFGFWFPTRLCFYSCSFRFWLSTGLCFCSRI